MSKNKTKEKPGSENDSVHILIAIKRKKENPEQVGKEYVIRQIVENSSGVRVGLPELDLLYHKIRLFGQEGMYRIYVTVNPRSKRKALRLYAKEIVDLGFEYNPKFHPESMWKTCLLQPCCRASKSFLLDLDSKDEKAKLGLTFFLSTKGIAQEVYETPNGYHFVTEPFDIRIIDGLNLPIELKRDGLLFIEYYDNRKYKKTSGMDRMYGRE